MVWTKALDEEVAQLKARGLSYSEIALCLDLTKNALIGRADRLRKKASDMPFTCKKVGRSRETLGVLTGILSVRENPDYHATNCRVSLDIPIYELERNECRWPTKESRGTHLFCAKPTSDGHSYCSGHTAMARQEWRRSGQIDKLKVRVA
jgi:hypothetical protein